MQNEYNLIYREEEREMIPACKDLGVGYNLFFQIF
jgi:1-deoxyxylulose-5-phosphate synthase